MQTILGANSVTARELFLALTSYTTAIRQVSRQPSGLFGGGLAVQHRCLAGAVAACDA